MKFKILKDFMVIVNKNKLIDYIPKDTKFTYFVDEIIENTKDPKYITLDKMYTGNLIEGIEYQIFITAITPNKKLPGPIVVEFDSIDNLIQEEFIKIIEK